MQKNSIMNIFVKKFNKKIRRINKNTANNETFEKKLHSYTNNNLYLFYLLILLIIGL